MLKQCTVRYFVEIHEVQTKLSVFEARGVANFGKRCSQVRPPSLYETETILKHNHQQLSQADEILWQKLKHDFKKLFIVATLLSKSSKSTDRYTDRYSNKHTYAVLLCVFSNEKLNKKAVLSQR